MNNKKIIPYVLIAVSVAAGVYFRFYPRWMPYLDILAKQEVENSEWVKISDSVRSKYPSAHASVELKLTNELFKDSLRSNRADIDAKIADKRASLRSQYLDEKGHTYLNGIDSYYWYRLLNNLIVRGHIGDRRENGVEYDDLIGNSIDPATTKNVHIWLGFIFYKTASFFNKDAYLSDVLFYVPIFLSCIIAAFSFLVARKLGASDLGAFFASIAVNLSPFLMMRSVGEWFDTDIYNVLFPLLAFGSFLFCFDKRGMARKVVASSFAGLFLAFYASTWKGWWFIFDIMVIAGLFFAMNQKTVLKEEGKDPALVKDALVSLGFLFVSTTFFVTLLNGFSVYKDIVAEPLRLFNILKITPSAWPNVYLTVAELGKMQPFQVAQSLGGNFLFFGSMFGLVYIFLAEHGLRDDRYGFGFLCLVLWIVATFYSSLEALRFVLLLVAPLGLAFGITISKAYEVVIKLAGQYQKKYLALAARLAAVCVFSSWLVYNTVDLHNKLLPTLPSLNDTWYNTLIKIKKDTPKDAIVDSWWDFGHWFKAVADRRVLFDGMTQNTPYAYWMASCLLSDNEEKAAGILRMINSSANKAADILEKEEGLSPDKAIEFIKNALGKDKAGARTYLKQHLKAGRVEEILACLFPDKLPSAYLIISYDMLVKINTISYIGSWDFANVDLWFKKKSLSHPGFIDYAMRKYGYKKEDAEKKYLEVLFLDEKESKKWFSHSTGFFSELAQSKQDGSLLFFDSGLVVNLADHHAYVASPHPSRRGVPKSLIYLEGGELKEVMQKDPNLSYSALVIEKDKKYTGLLIDQSLAKSLIVRMYYFGGEGLKHFKLFDKEEDKNGGFIYVFEVK